MRRRISEEAGIAAGLDARYRLSMTEYDAILGSTDTVRFGTRDTQLAPETMPGIGKGGAGTPRLVLEAITGYHRKYRWI